MGFCELASSLAEQSWLASSAFSILIDMAIFELVPALAVGCLGVLSFGCHAKCFLKLLFLIEGYRALRSFVGT